MDECTKPVKESTLYERIGELESVVGRIESKLFPPQELPKSDSLSMPVLQLLLGRLVDLRDKLEMIDSQIAKI